MANFYNPYSKNIQWAQGFSDILNQYETLKALRGMYGGGETTAPSQAPTSLPPNRGMANMGAQQMTGMAPTMVPPPEGFTDYSPNIPNFRPEGRMPGQGGLGMQLPQMSSQMGGGGLSQEQLMKLMMMLQGMGI